MREASASTPDESLATLALAPHAQPPSDVVPVPRLRANGPDVRLWRLCDRLGSNSTFDAAGCGDRLGIDRYSSGTYVVFCASCVHPPIEGNHDAQAPDPIKEPLRPSEKKMQTSREKDPKRES